MGAALKANISHWSRPRFYLILLKTSFLARLQPRGNCPPLIYAYVPSGAIALAQSAILRLSPVVCAPMAAIFSSIFSHTRGTAMKSVLYL